MEEHQDDEFVAPRRAGEAVIHSLLPAGEALPRESVRLRWTGPDEARYEVLVMDEDLETVARAEDLEETEFLVPPEALDGLPPGARLLWQVEAVLPDGDRLTSPTFALKLD